MSAPGSVTTGVSNASLPNQSTTNPVCCEHDDRSTDLVFILVYSVLFLVALVLNSFTLWIHCCQPQRNASKSFMIYMKNLTAADFLLCLSLPLRIIHYATRSVTIHLLYCSFGASILFLNMYASILFMGYIALNRYFKVVHPFGAFFLLTKRAACITCLTTWVFLLTPMTVYSTVLLKSRKPDWSCEKSCEDLHSDSVKLIYRTFHIGAFVIFLLVSFSMVFSYYSASRRVLQAQQSQSASFGSRKLQRSRRKMLVLICIFCICFVPYHLIRLLYTFLHQLYSSDRVFHYLMEFTTIVSILNVCLDPLVYFIFCKDFRVHLRLRLRVAHQEENEARRSNEEQLRSINLNKAVTPSTTSRSTGEV
ncbi:P2Y purinoceptor 14-like [Poeciliopsis prolifica]|uniref:P2Y purinoceptor 14-like n=1 Tax=Poeciliopsis prolifica TaxID=188132 RepID=UPI0024135BCE|nr:P2Y purinoceptor 14-like [Poeciliopsis prolifica]